jgi:hypothetical protein
MSLSGVGVRAADSRGDHAPGDHNQNALMESALDRQLLAVGAVVCHETIARYSRNGNATTHLDTLETDVDVIDGTERYSTVQRKRKAFSGMHDVPGTWSVGEVATLLQISRDAVRLGIAQIGEEETAGLGRTLAMTFTYSGDARRWYLKVKSQLYWMPFEGRVWVSPETGEVLRISWHACDVPAESGVSEVLWTVDFKPVDVSSRPLTLPLEARYQVTYEHRADRIDWNVTHFSQYRRYGTDSSIHFDE